MLNGLPSPYSFPYSTASSSKKVESLMGYYGLDGWFPTHHQSSLFQQTPNNQKFVLIPSTNISPEFDSMISQLVESIPSIKIVIGGYLSPQDQMLNQKKKSGSTNYEHRTTTSPQSSLQSLKSRLSKSMSSSMVENRIIFLPSLTTFQMRILMSRSVVVLDIFPSSLPLSTLFDALQVGAPILSLPSFQITNFHFYYIYLYFFD